MSHGYPVLGQGVKGQGHRVTKCKKTFQAMSGRRKKVCAVSSGRRLVSISLNQYSFHRWACSIRSLRHYFNYIRRSYIQ